MVSALVAAQRRVVKITDDLMPADFLTKWVPKEKLKRSVDHASNAPARAVHWGNRSMPPLRAEPAQRHWGGCGR